VLGIVHVNDREIEAILETCCGGPLFADRAGAANGERALACYQVKPNDEKGALETHDLSDDIDRDMLTGHRAFGPGKLIATNWLASHPVFSGDVRGPVGSGALRAAVV